jgi:hypothetical protein
LLGSGRLDCSTIPKGIGYCELPLTAPFKIYCSDISCWKNYLFTPSKVSGRGNLRGEEIYFSTPPPPNRVCGDFRDINILMSQGPPFLLPVANCKKIENKFPVS